MRQRLLLAWALLVSGCAGLPDLPAPTPAQQTAWLAHRQSLAAIGDWRMQGRFALHSSSEHWTGSLTWESSANGDYRLQLSSPLGQGLVALYSDAAGVTLVTANQQTLSDSDAEALFARALGWHMPLAAMQRWVLGLPAAAGEFRFQLAEQGWLQTLYQDRWRVQFLDYHQDLLPPLPRRLQLVGRELQLKLVVDNWSVLNNAAVASPP